MKINFYISVFLIFILPRAYAQQKVQGKVVDELTGQLIPYTSVVIEGSSIRTITNEDGKFELNADKLPVKISFSHLNYQNTEILIEDLQEVSVKLKPTIITLQEVVIDGDPALALIKKAFEKAKQQADDAYTAKSYLRQLIFDGGKPFYLTEIAFDAEWKNNSFTRWNPTNSRYLAQKDHHSIINFTNVSVFSFSFTGFTKSGFPIRNKPDSLYSFKITRVYQKESHEIAVIYCKLKSPYPKNQGLFFEGDFYIDKNTYDIVKADGIMRNTDIPKGTGPQKIRLRDMHISSEYKLNEEGNTILDFSIFHFVAEVHYRGIRIAKSQYNSTILMLNDRNINANELKPIEFRIKDIELAETIPPKDEFWNNNQIIKYTEKEKEAIRILENQSK